MVTKIIQELITEPLESLFGRMQADIRSRSSCTEHINAFRIYFPLMSFDSVNRNYLWNSLPKRVTPEKPLAVHRATFDGVECHVLQQCKLSEEFEVQNGVHQGRIFYHGTFSSSFLDAVVYAVWQWVLGGVT